MRSSPPCTNKPAGQDKTYSHELTVAPNSFQKGKLVMPKAFIKTYGCQMNEHDSSKMMDVLTDKGYKGTQNIEDADLIVVNTCSVRHNPENKVYSFLGRLADLKKNNKELIIAVAGCVAQQTGKQILDRSPVVDMVFGPDNFFELPQMIESVKNGQRVLMTEWRDRTDGNVQNFIPEQWIEAGHADGPKAYVAIMKGCNNFCSFCIVPMTRGREAYRHPENIMREIHNLVDKGAKELWLLGQNVNSYRADNRGFLELLDDISKVEGLKRIRFTSPHPKDWNNKLSDLMAERPNICNHLHLPLQAGSNRILKLMRRRHTNQDYLDKVQYLRSVCPAAEISTDIIVGFPTETDEEFEETLNMIKQVQYSQVFSFKYSPRPGTKAEEMPDDVPLDTKRKRLERVIKTQERINEEKLAPYIGTVHQVMIDGRHPKKPDIINGRTDGHRPVAVKGSNANIGDFINVRITGFHAHWLEGMQEK